MARTRNLLVLRRAKALARYIECLVRFAWREPPGLRRTRAVAKLYDVLAVVDPRFVELAGSLNRRMPKIERTAFARSTYRAWLPVAKRVKSLFEPHLGALMAGKMSPKLITEILAHEPEAHAVAEELRFAWTTSTLIDLCGDKPSEWLIKRVALRARCGPRTIKKLIYV